MESKAQTHFTTAFWSTLALAAGLIIGGFFCPPMGEINGSILTAVGLIFLWPALGFGAKALDEGHIATIKHNGTEINISRNNE